MRQSAHPSARVRAAVDFMAHFYSGRALAQGALGKSEEALRETRLILEAVATDASAAGGAIPALTEVAAAGYAREVLEQLVESPAAAALELLVVGLRIYLGESPLVAQEILEVGKDVAERIRRLRAAREEPPTPSALPPAAPRTG